MIVTFGTAELAALCNSEHLMQQQWGNETAQRVGRRLLDLAAVSRDALHLIPTAQVVGGDRGKMTITFHGYVVVRGILNRSDGNAADPDHLHISSVKVTEGAPA